MATNGFYPNCKALLPHPRRGGEALDLLGSPVRNSAALATRVSPTCRGLSAHRAAHSARQPSPGPRCCSSPKTPAIASSTCIDPTLPAYELFQRLGIRLVRRRVPHEAGPGRRHRGAFPDLTLAVLGLVLGLPGFRGRRRRRLYVRCLRQLGIHIASTRGNRVAHKLGASSADLRFEPLCIGTRAHARGCF
jgi:hypothetical protein